MVAGTLPNPGLKQVQGGDGTEGSASHGVSSLMETLLCRNQLNTYFWSISIDYLIPFGNEVAEIFSH